MKTFAKSLTALAVAAAAMVSVPAQAVTVTFDYQTPTDGSGKTSWLVNSDNTSSNPFIFIETFDVPKNTSHQLLDINGSDPGGRIDIAAGGGFNSLNPFTDLAISTGSLGIQKGSNSNGAMPAGDSTFYAYGPGPTRPNGSNATVRVDYAATLAGINANYPGTKVSYLGLYYGSIDTYNNIAFYNGNTLITGGGGYLDDGVITGAEVLAARGGFTGNQTDDGSNVYVNFFFNPNETFTAFEFRTTDIAFEVDNVVTGLTIRDIPEPASIALIGLGLLGLAGMRRKV